MAGYGNRTNIEPNLSNLTDSHNSTRLGREDSHPYTGATDREYGSGATHGAGFGNKSAAIPSPSEMDSNETRFGTHENTDPYSGAREHKSGSVGGAGWGNKTGAYKESHDSTTGKLMEKVGHVMHNENLAEKGRAKREAQGLGQTEEQ